MKKYLKIIFVLLAVVLTAGKHAFASSAGITGEQAVYYLKNTKGFINKLIRVYNDREKLTERQHAEKNLAGVSNHPLTRPIVEQAFDDVEKEGKAYEGNVSEKARISWWDRFFTIRKTYVGR
jgi:hypothetical protein